jgi:hypothetical protein
MSTQNCETKMNDIEVHEHIPIIIGLCGKKRSGKDTIGRYLVEKHGFHRLAFADPLKLSCQEIFGFTDAQMNGDEKEIIDPYWNHSPRQVFQAIGTDLFRNTLPQYCHNMTSSIWIRTMHRKITVLMKQGINKFVITDVRFPDEFNYVKSGTLEDNGGTNNSLVDASFFTTSRYMWKVSRSTNNQDFKGKATDGKATDGKATDGKAPVSTVSHSSEVSLDGYSCDVEFFNNGTIDALLKNVSDVLFINLNM